MKKQRVLTILAAAALCQSALAGGYLTNTNHSIAFGREPSRDAAIGIDGAYANPAGLLFLPQGLQLQFNYQNATQHRYIESTFAPFAYGVKNGGKETKKFEGSAYAPFLPSIHVSYNPNEKWNFNGSFAVVGGGGKCEFDGGLASFESILAAKSPAFQALGNGVQQIKDGLSSVNPALGGLIGDYGFKNYDLDCYLMGKQYYFGIQAGAGYKINDYLSVSLQARVVIGTSEYKGHLKDIKINGTAIANHFGGVVSDLSNPAIMPALDAAIDKLNAGIAKYEALGAGETQEAQNLKKQLAGVQTLKASIPAVINQVQDQAQQSAAIVNGVNLDCDQSGLGFIPIIGIDWRPNKYWNFAAKYEFNTKMRLKNKSNVNDQMVAAISALNQFKDGNKVPEDMPALLTLGAMYSPIEAVRINAGYHCYFDQNAKKYGDSQKLLDGNTMEYSAGVEWDFLKNWTVSCGVQYAKYANTDAYMKDISFNTNAATYGFGFQYRLNEHWDIDAAYFISKYEKWHKDSDNYNGSGMKGSDIFWRDNKVWGIGVTYKL